MHSSFGENRLVCHLSTRKLFPGLLVLQYILLPDRCMGTGKNATSKEKRRRKNEKEKKTEIRLCVFHTGHIISILRRYILWEEQEGCWGISNTERIGLLSNSSATGRFSRMTLYTAKLFKVSLFIWLVFTQGDGDGWKGQRKSRKSLVSFKKGKQSHRERVESGEDLNSFSAIFFVSS